MWPRSRSSATCLLVGLFLVSFTTTALADPAPVPSLSPGDRIVPASWDCVPAVPASEGTLAAPELCEVRSWTVLLAPSPSPSPSPIPPAPTLVEVVGPVTVNGGTTTTVLAGPDGTLGTADDVSEVGGLPLPVLEQSPLPVTAPSSGSTFCSPSAGSPPPASPSPGMPGEPSSSPSPSVSGSPGPSASATPSATTTDTCRLVATVDEGQAFGLWLFLGALLLLAVFGVVRREGRAFRA